MSTQGIDQLLREMRSASALAAGNEPAAAQGSAGADFAALLKASIDQVSGAQQQAEKLQQEFSSNANGANLQEVMISLQKANLSFQTMVQVRNKLVTAYQEIMNMQV